MARSASTDPLDKFRFFVFESASSFGITSTQKTEIKDGKNVVVSATFKITKPDNVSGAGFTSVQMPKINTTKITYREGDSPSMYSISPGITSTEDITLSKGVVGSIKGENTSSWFYEWAQAVKAQADTTTPYDFVSGSNNWAENKDFRKDLSIVMLNRDGTIARHWRIYNAFPVNFIPGSDLNASEDGEKSIESVTLAYESFTEEKIEAL